MPKVQVGTYYNNINIIFQNTRDVSQIE